VTELDKPTLPEVKKMEKHKPLKTIPLYTVSQKCPLFYFWNNSVKNKAISIIFGTVTKAPGSRGN